MGVRGWRERAEEEGRSVKARKLRRGGRKGMGRERRGGEGRRNGEEKREGGEEEEGATLSTFLRHR